jgi:UDP-glucose 6-dehydrogenase
MSVEKTGLKIGIIGFGVVGSATANRLYDLGNEIYVNDVKSPKDLKYWNDKFVFKKNYNISETDITMLSLPTASEEERLLKDLSWSERRRLPEGKCGEALDKSAFEPVIKKLGNNLKYSNKHHLFIVRSTVEPGYTRKCGQSLEKISKKSMGRNFSMVMLPEFLRAFNSIEDEKNLKMIVVGSHDKKGLDLVKRMYQNLSLDENNQSKIYPMSLEEAELIKLENNAINAIWISLHNAREEFYEMLSEKKVPINYERMTKVLTTMTESFTNPNYGTKAGVPFGGTCLKKDPNALHTWAEDEMGVKSYFTDMLSDAIHENIHLQRRILNAHKIPKTTRKSLEELSGRDHKSYENIRKVSSAVDDLEKGYQNK